MNKVNRLLFFITVLIISGCNGNKSYIPKPPTFLKIELEERTYADYVSDCNFKFIKPDYFNPEKAQQGRCNLDIDFTRHNGTVHLSFIKMDTSLSAYVNYAIDKVDEHKIKATAIKDTNFINETNDAFGTFFELQGNVATPFQFYLTDSTSHFMSGVVYFNTRPNYDSIRPVLNYVKADLYKLMETFVWETHE